MIDKQLNKNKMNYQLMIWIDAEARNIGSHNLYNPQTCELTISGLQMTIKNTERQPTNNIEEIKEIALMEYSLWGPSGGCVEILHDNKSIYHISEDSNHQLEQL